MECKIPPKTIDELIKQIYHDWGWDKEPSFIDDIKNKDAEKFAIELHRTIGMRIRNSFGLWSGDTELYHHCVSLGLKHADDMSHKILVELHKYATEQLNKKS